jgi:hypothetical protein
MKTFLLTACVFGVLMVASAAPGRAGDLFGTGQHKLRLADACETNCRTNADACRAQCGDPEEKEQCIVNCGRSECKSGCDKFERSCTEHCPSSKG